MADQDHQKAFTALCDVLAHLDNSNEIQQFLRDLCTPAEMQAMADRWRVVDPIKAGTSYRAIHANTGVSVTTIGRVARYITHGNGGYNLAYKRMQSKKEE